MNVFPQVSVARFQQLQPGDLFILLDSESNCVGVKTAKPANGDPSEIALLGPSFPRGNTGPFLVSWRGANCVAFGQDYTVLLPTSPSAWSESEPPIDVLCLACVDQRMYVRVNGDKSGRPFFPCYVDLASGAIVEKSLSAVAGIAAYASQWEIVATHPNVQPRSILKVPY